MDTIGSLAFLSPHSDNPAFIMHPPGTPSERRGDYYDIPVRLRDGRTTPDAQTGLDICGFTLCHAPTSADFSSESSIRASYYPEVTALARRETGATFAAILDHTIRSSAPDTQGRSVVTHVHNDYTPRSAMGHANRLAHEAGLAPGWRALQINIWRPLSEPVLMAPLAVADAASIRPEDLVTCDLIYPDRKGEIYELRYHPAQRWFWFPMMMRDEALIFKGHDSGANAPVRHTPHTSFQLQGTGPDTPPRISIETRIFCFFPQSET